MAMVGSMNRHGQPVALVRVDKLLYQVRVGDYLGLNYGRITRINETEVALREIVQDAAGEWIERVATLQLQERCEMNHKKSTMADGGCALPGWVCWHSARSLSAHAQNAIEAVTSSTQSGAEVVRIDLAQPLTAVPTGFAVQTPARIALDFPGVTQRHRALRRRGEPGQPAFRQRGSGR
jgi:hypothetical protein